MNPHTFDTKDMSIILYPRTVTESRVLLDCEWQLVSGLEDVWKMFMKRGHALISADKS